MRARAVLFLLLASGCQPVPTPAPSPTPVAALPREPLLPWGDAPEGIMEPLQLAAAAVQAGSRERALSQLRALEPKAATSSDVAERLSRFYERLGFVDKAYLLAEQAVKIAPRSASALMRLARVEQDVGYTPQAREHYRTALEAQPDAIETHLAIVSLYELELQLTEAEKELRNAHARDQTDPAILGLLARNLVLQGRFSEARQALDAAEKEAPGAPPALLERGNIALQEAKRDPGQAAKHLAESRSFLEACLKVEPENASALFLLGKAAEESGDLAGARKAWERSYQLKPDQDGLRIYLGRLLIRLGEAAKGTALLETEEREHRKRDQRARLAGRVAAAPDLIERHRELARWCAQNQMLSQALLEWELVLRKAPTDPEALAQKAQLSARR